MALAVIYEWVVTINDRWKYTVKAPFCAEAQHEAVCLWRKDEMLSLEDRSERIQSMRTDELACLSDQVSATHARLGAAQLVIPTTRRPQAQHLPYGGRVRRGEQMSLCNQTVVPWPGAGEKVLPLCTSCKRRAGRKAPVDHG